MLANVSGGSATSVTIGGVKYGANSWTLYWVALLIYQKLYDIPNQISYSNNYLKAIDTSGKSIVTALGYQGAIAGYIDNFYNLSKQHHSALMDALGVHGTLATYVNNFYNLSKQQQTANNSLISKGFDDILQALGYQGTIAGYIDNFYNLSKQHQGQTLDRLDSIKTFIDNFYNLSKQHHDSLMDVVSEIRLFTSRHVLNVPDEYGFYTLWDLLYSIMVDSDNIEQLLVGLQQTLTAWGNRWDSQDLYLMEWAKRWDALDKGGTWSESDKGALFAKLDGISDRLSVEAGQTVLDALLGEVKPQYINDQLTIVKEVARNRFPFCIPAMMQQMLGLMQSEAQVPHWEFDFFGSPLVLDLGDLESFALVTRWASCFMLFLALLANTKRFIFDLGGGGK